MTLARPKVVIRRRYDVQEEDKTAVFRHGDSQPDWGGRGNLFFIGMEGSGRRAMARAAAALLGLEYAEADSPEALARLAGGFRQAIAAALPGPPDPALAARLREAGKVFHLMRQACDLAAARGDASIVPALAQEIQAMEPSFMAAAHFILPLYATRDEWLADVAEKARL